jgi:hypothetical protein
MCQKCTVYHILNIWSPYYAGMGHGLLYRRYKVKAYLPNPMWCYRCQKFGHTQTRCTSDIVCPKCGVKDQGDTICPWPIQCINCSGAHSSNSLDCPIDLQETAIQKILVEECSSFPEAWKRYFELQPKHMNATYAQAAASRPSTSEMLTQTDNAAAAKVQRFTPSSPGHNLKHWNYPNNCRPMNQESSPHTNKALLDNTMTVWTTRAKAPFLTQNYPAKTWTWIHQTT